MIASSAHEGRLIMHRPHAANSGALWDACPRHHTGGFRWNPIWNQHLGAAPWDTKTMTYGRYVVTRPSRDWCAADPNCKPIAYFAPSSMRRAPRACVPHSSHTSR